MKIHDIFSKSKIKKYKKNEKQKIKVDYREKNSFVPAHLAREGFEIEFKELKVADYIVKNTAIERKTISDFVSSMLNKRLFRQIEELQQYKNRLLIIEGLESQELYSDEKQGVSANALRGFLLSIVLKYKIPVLFSKNPEDTARFISVLSKKKEKESSLRAVKKTMNKREQMQFILEGFSGIGPKNAKKLLEKFSTLQNIFLAPQEELKKTIGKKAEIFMLLEEKFIK